MAEGHSPVPLAIIGIGCRLPGDATSPEKLWELVSGGKSAWTPVPKDRWNEEAFRHPSPDDNNGTHNHSGGHFLRQDVGEFDAGFFNLPPQEAAAMDPQQRLLLETTYEALESAGLPIEAVRGSDTSVHMAMFTRDYDRNIYKDVLNIPKYHVTGTGEAILANRISHLFDLRGPSMTIDTGCSGGMTAVHQACQSLRSGETNMALAGAANLILSPDHMISMSNLHMLNPDGKSYSFDARGNGYGRGEGVVTLVIKRLDDAIKSRDPIRAVIRETAINQDGRTQGITLPSSEAQAALEHQAWRSIGIDPSDAAYVEAHGTGTVAGDERELDAISSVFCSNRDTPLFVGSIKSNIGHLESVSGLAALIKASMMLEHTSIPPNANFQSPKPSLKLDQRNLVIPQATYPLHGGSRARISVNSFGYGGTNAHVILEQPPQIAAQPLTAGDIPSTCSEEQLAFKVPYLFLISGKSREAMALAAKGIQEWATERQSHLPLADLAYTLSCRRSIFPWRFSCVANNSLELTQALEKREKDDTATRAPSEIKMTFVFTGQGAQWPQMACELLPVPVFNESLCMSRDILTGLGASWDLMEELLRGADASRLHVAELSQPVTTAMQIALVDLLHSLGITPEAVVGHSSGEIAAAYSAGYLSKASALRVAYYRGFSSAISKDKGCGKGAMIAIGLGERDVAPYISKLSAGLASVACQNSPSSTTASGDEAAIDQLSELLSDDAIFNRKLNVDTAYHSHHMQAAALDYRDSISAIETGTSTPSCRLFSSVTGSERNGEFGADYWVSNLVSKVRFCDAVQALSQAQQDSANRAHSHHIFVEIGPHSALAGPTRQSLADMPHHITYDYESVLVRNTDAMRSLLTMVGKLFDRGCIANMTAVSALNIAGQSTRVIPDLPSYPWDHTKSYWHESRISRDYRLRTHPYHDLLGVKMTESTTIQPRWRHLVGFASLPWLADHVVDGLAIFPGAGYLCMATEAACQLASDHRPDDRVDRVVLKDIAFLRGLVIPESPGRVELQLGFYPVEESNEGDRLPRYRFSVTAYSQDCVWHEYCRGLIAIEFEDPNSRSDDQMAVELYHSTTNHAHVTAENPVAQKDLYDELDRLGNTYGPMFSGIEDYTMANSSAACDVTIPDVASVMPAGHLCPHTIHPTTLDILLHSSLPLVHQNLGPGSVMPVRIEAMEISSRICNQAGQRLSARTQLITSGLKAADAEISVYSSGQVDSSLPVLSVAGLELRSLATSTNDDSVDSENRGICHELRWGPDADFLTSRDLYTTYSSPSRESKLRIMDDATTIYISRCLDAIRSQGLEVKEENHKLLMKWMTDYISTQQAIEFSHEDTLKLSSQQGVEGEFLARLGPKLADIMSSSASALQIMLEDDLLYRVYADDSSACCYSLMSEYVKHLAFKQANLSVLEIGGGTGGATLPFMKALDAAGAHPACYDFTDVSAGFFDRAKDKLQDWAGAVHFKTLDIEQDPLTQGFQAGQYDVVVASNVLHATGSINETLRRVHSLLKPNGTLLLIEVSNPQPYLNITFGTLPGWWKGAAEGRSEGPFLSANGWRKAFSETCFATQLVANDSEHSPVSSLIVAKTLVAPSPQRIRIVMDSDAPRELTTFAEAYTARLRADGFHTMSTTWDEPYDHSVNAHIVLDDGCNPLLSNAKLPAFQSATALLQSPSRVFWITPPSDNQASDHARKHLINGFARTAHAENENLDLTTVEIQGSLDTHLQALFGSLQQILSVSFRCAKETREREYVIRPDCVLIPRVIQSEQLNNWTSEEVLSVTGSQDFRDPRTPLCLDVSSSGKAPSITFIEDGSHQYPLGETEVEIDTRAVGFPVGGLQSTIYEYSGVISGVGQAVLDLKIGDRVVAISTIPCASRPRVNSELVHHISNATSFTTAASLPSALMSIYHAFVTLTRLSAGQTVVIDGAHTHIGQIAVAMAVHLGARVVSVTSRREAMGGEDKLIELLSISTIPREGHQCRRARRAVLPSGADVVLNASGSPISAEIAGALRPFGILINVGQRGDGSSSFKHPPLPADTTATSFNIDSLLRYKPQDSARLFHLAIEFSATTALFESCFTNVCELKSLGSSLKAFKETASSTKLILNFEDSSDVQVARNTRSVLSLEAAAAFVVSGGLGDLGKRFLRLMAKAGAKTLVTLSRRGPDTPGGSDLQDELSKLGAGCRLYNIKCDVSKESSVLAAREEMRCLGITRIKGVVQAAIVLQDSTLDNMTVDILNGPLETKMHGTLNLQTAFSPDKPDFFISLSSAVGVLGTSGQANYNAGNTLQDALAQFQSDSCCHYMSLNIGTIEDAEATVGNQARIQALRRQGLTLIRSSELLSFFEFSMSPEARNANFRQAIIGFNADSIAQTTATNGAANSPMFTHIRRTHKAETETSTESQKMSFSDLLSESHNLDDISNFIAESIGEKLSSLVAVEASEIDLGRPISEYGLDSLIAIELRNWIMREFGSPLQSSEVLDDGDLISLARKVASRSPQVQSSAEDTSSSERSHISTPVTSRSSSANPFKDNTAPGLPQLPSPDFQEIIELLVASRQVFATPEEIDEVSDATKAFRVASSPILQLPGDQSTQDIRFKAYEEEVYLSRREPLQDYSTFYFGHPVDGYPTHTQVERAAIITLAALDYKTQLDLGTASVDTLNETALCMKSQDWLFHTTRQPHAGTDSVVKHPSSRSVIIMKEGHVFQMTVPANATLAMVKSAFEEILPSASTHSQGVGTLTTLGRDEWAVYRDQLLTNPDDADTMSAIEAAAFVLCLDNAAPATPSERCTTFMLSDHAPENRWLDKTIQFVVAANGASALVGEHSKLDGLSVRQLCEATTTAIQHHDIDALAALSEIKAGSVPVEELRFNTSDSLASKISEQQQHFRSHYPSISCVPVGLPSLGRNHLAAAKLPANATAHLTIMLATYLFYGRHEPIWETASLGFFDRGRIDWAQTVTAAAASFVTAAASSSASVQANTNGQARDLRRLLQAAATAHTKLISRVASGRGFVTPLYHLLGLAKARQAGAEDDLHTELPALFRTKAWQESERHATPKRIKTDCLGSGSGFRMQEAGFLMPGEDSIFVHYEVRDEEGYFVCHGGIESTLKFETCLRGAADIVRNLIDAV